jgi:glycosyltransferase involved in cell wall biosynthesis
VIAYRRGSVPEVITHGHDGFIVTDIDEAVAAASTTTIDRRNCRATFEQRFSSEIMAAAHIETYEYVINTPRVALELPSPEAAVVSAWRTTDDPRGD